MKQFILGLTAGIALTASYFILTGGEKPSEAVHDSRSDSATGSEQSQKERAERSASEKSSSPDNQDEPAEHASLDMDSPSNRSGDSVSRQTGPNLSESQVYLDEYDRELRDRIEAISETLDLSNQQRLKLEERLLDQKDDLIGKVGEEFLDRIMIDEFSIGLEEDLTESQIEEFSKYKREKAMHLATLSSEAIVAGVKESTGISDERASELEHALIEANYKNRMLGEFTNPMSVIENSLTPEEWNAFRTKKR